MQAKATRRKRASYLTMSDEEFTTIALGCRTLTELALTIGNKPRANGQSGYGRGYSAIRNRVRELKLCDHFDKNHKRRRTDTLTDYDDLKTRSSVRYRIIADNLIPYECAVPACRNPGTWLGQPVALHLDHIDGDNSNHALDNLRWLCPNCHAQTETYGGKNMRRRKLAAAATALPEVPPPLCIRLPSS